MAAHDFAFATLELWRASSLAAETRSVIAAYEQCLAANDVEGLANLRRAIERRIDELDAFYTAHVDDERSMLFDKQRLKLRKLLHEYDEAVRAVGWGAGGGGAGAGGVGGSPAGAPGQRLDAAALGGASSSAAAGGARGYDGGASSAAGGAAGARGGGGGGAVTRQIREDSRLSLPELLSWFTQAGTGEMPEVGVPVVEKLFASVTRTNVDGRMSVRDLRQWYVSYGKRALRAGVSSFDGEVVPAALVKRAGDAGGAPGGGAGARKPGAPAGGGAAAGDAPPLRAMYAWEEAGASGHGGAGGGAGGDAAAPAPLALPNHMLEFQVRLTPDEYAAFSQKRRGHEAELRYKERVAKGHSQRAALKGDRLTGGAGADDAGADAADSRYVDPVSSASYILRS